jgi:hypothetical protein
MGEPEMSMISQLQRRSPRTVNVKVVLGPDLGSLVDRDTTTIEYSTQHVLGDGQLHGRSRKGDSRSQRVDTSRTFKHLSSVILQLDQRT